MKTHGVYLNGAFHIPETSYEVKNPASGEVIARMCSVSRAVVAQAVADAHNAFARWKRLPAKSRGEFLFKIADELQKRAEEIAKLNTLENGKPLAQSQGEVAMSLDHLRWFGEEAKRGYGRIVP